MSDTAAPTTSAPQSTPPTTAAPPELPPLVEGAIEGAASAENPMLGQLVGLVLQRFGPQIEATLTKGLYEMRTELHKEIAAHEARIKNLEARVIDRVLP